MIKRIVLGIGICLTGGLTADAQLSQGGLPLSMLQNLEDTYVPVAAYPLPDWEATARKWNEDEEAGVARPYLVAATAATDIGFPNSGTMTELTNGKKVWRVKLHLDHAPATGLYYDLFQLPKGVNYFITNGNRKQILGAYNYTSNDASLHFASEPVQGGVVNIEMDIDEGVDMAAIRFHINKAAVYNSGVSYLGEYTDGGLQLIDQVDSALAGSSSVCMINAICPLGTNYAIQRNAAFQWLIPVGGGVGACSATMINVAGNTAADCKQYCLLASHCDGQNATTDAAFSQVLLRFGFQQPTCTVPNGAVPNTTHTLNGANFLARSIVPGTNPNNIKGDFLLLQLKQSIPASWRVNLAGWNNAVSIPTTATAPQKFIGFHHPLGDVKKTSATHVIQSEALGAPDSHWGVQLDSGYASEGSSGSALFDGTGRIIGVATAAGQQNVPAACNVTATGATPIGPAMNVLFYSKLSYDWNYAVDGAGAAHSLKPWLDPNNTGAVTIDAVSSTCQTPFADTTGSGTNGISIAGNDLDNSISLYPNPTVSGKVELSINLKKEATLSFQVMDISGKKLKSYIQNNVLSGKFVLDLSQYTNGMYFIQITDGAARTTRKVMLTK